MMKQKIGPVLLRNVRNNEVVVCDDVTNIRTIDGQDFVEVRLENSPRKFWLNKVTLTKVTKKN
jgi:hypothetical protein